MPPTVVVGSPTTQRFSVIDFTNLGSPVVTEVDPIFSGNCIVALDGVLVACGSQNSSTVQLVDVSDPQNPVLRGSIGSQINNAGAIAILGDRVVVGESAGTGRISVIDVSNPNSPAVSGVISINIATGTLAFTAPRAVVVAGGSSDDVLHVDFSDINNPAITPISPFAPNTCSVAADPDATRLAVGEENGTNPTEVALIRSDTLQEVQRVDTTLQRIISPSIDDPLVLAGTSNDTQVARISFAGTTLSVTTFDPGLNSGCVTAISGNLGVCAPLITVGSTEVKLFDLSPATPSLLSTATLLTSQAVGTLAISTAVAQIPAGAVVSLSQTNLIFGVVRVGTPASQTVTIQNSGTADLTVDNFASSDPAFTFAVNPPLSSGGSQVIAPGGSADLTVTFTPTAEATFNGAITFDTNDPNLPVATVAVGGEGGAPRIAVPAGPIGFGNVAVCLSSSETVRIENSGAVQLTISSVTAAPDPPFSVSPSTATVGPSGSVDLQVTYAPTAQGQSNGTLTVNSDAVNTIPPLPLTGNGLPTPPPTAEVEPPPSQSQPPEPWDFRGVPLQYFAGRRVRIANTGPCEDLDVTLTIVQPPGEPDRFFLSADANPTAVPPANTPVSEQIPPGEVRRFVVVYAPDALGTHEATLDITTNDPNQQNISIDLEGTGVAPAPAALELVLDQSWSMNDPSPQGTKLDALKNAVRMFADLLLSGQGDAMGSVHFSAHADILTPIDTFDEDQQTTIKDDAGGLTPQTSTGIGEAMQLAQTELTSSSVQRKTMLVFTDGKENEEPEIADVKGAILGAGTEVYAIGLGAPEQISSQALSEIAASSEGRFFVTDDDLALRKDFVQVFADAFRQQMAADPVQSIGAGETTDIPVLVTDCDRRISFVLNWEAPGTQLGLTVRAPDGTTFDPNTPAGNQLVRYGQAPLHRWISVALPPLEPGSGEHIGPQRNGVWTMRVHGPARGQGRARFAASVAVESDLEMRTWIEADDAHWPLRIVAEIVRGGRQPIEGATVIAKLRAPRQNVRDLLTPELLQRAMKHASPEPERIVDRALRLLVSEGKPLVSYGDNGEIRLTQGRNGRYVAEIPASGIEGVYRCEIEAVGEACGGKFQRYSSFAVYVPRRMSAGTTKATVEPAGPLGVRVIVTPADAQGVPLGPGLTETISAEVDRGRVLGVRDNLDDSYDVQVAWATSARANVLRLGVNGQELSVPLGPRSDTGERRLDLVAGTAAVIGIGLLVLRAIFGRRR